MNKEKQDILYSRARAVLNNNVKRLWFKINPFLERKKTLKGKPEYETKFVQPLKSAILCENYIINEGDESARDTRNVPMGEFWDFLYSNKWSNGCAIRVLEGELMEELMYWLHVCVRNKSIATHKTYAFARNKRERRGCYKLANQKGCVEIEETLLIEFTYYGNPVEPPSSSDLGSSCYRESTPTSSEIPATKSSAAQFEDSEKGKTSEQVHGESFLPPIHEGSLYTTRQNESGVEYSRGNVQRLQVIDVVPKLLRMQRFPSNDSSDSGATLPSFNENLTMFRCTERIESGSEVEGSIYECSEENKLADDFGEELYLSDKIGTHQIESTADKLARNKVLLARRREVEKARENLIKRSQNKMKLPPMPDFDLDNIGIESKGVSTFKFAFMVTKVPSFEEFLNILDTEERFDPRYKKSRQMNKKIARRYNLTKETLNKRNLELVDMNADVKKRFSVLGKLPIFTKKGGGALNEISEESKPATSDSRVSNQLQLATKKTNDSKTHVENVAATVNGVTDSKECENHVLKNYCPSPSGKSGRRKSFVKPKVRIPRLIVTSPSGSITTIIGSASPLPKYKPKAPVKSKKSLGKKESATIKERSNTRTQIPSVISTESYSTDSEDPEYDDTEFDTSRLNRKYSLDRLDKIKGKNFRKKKPAFYEILKKYYRAQRAIDLFTKSPSPDKKIRKKSIFQRLLETKPPEPKYEMVLGKLKRFPFLRSRDLKKERDIDPFDFKNPSSKEFLNRLKQSLDDFVVRKEHVMSDYRGKTSTTLTFTRKGVFGAHPSYHLPV